MATQAGHPFGAGDRIPRDRNLLQGQELWLVVRLRELFDADRGVLWMLPRQREVG